MSWATKYKGEFKDNQGNDWDVEFQFDGYSGSTYNIKLGGEPLVIQKNVNNEQLNHIATKTAIISIECKQHFRFLELYSSGNLYCRVYITKNSSLYFLGYVMNDYQEPYDDLPYFVQVKAIDALPYLKEIAYDDNGTPYNGHKRINKIVLDILGKIGYTSFTEYINLYERYMNQNTDDSMFDQTLINVDVFAGKDCYYVLSEILKILNAALVQSLGEMTFYRPAELINETVYGRTFTGETTKTGTSITPEVFIDRADLDSNLHSTDGGVLTFEQPAKNVKVNFNYGNRESWIDNYNLPASSWDADNKTLDYWTRTGTAANVVHMSELMPEEDQGMAIKSTADHVTGLYQLFGDYTSGNPGEYVVFEFEYAIYNPTSSLIGNACGRIGITHKDTTLGLFVADTENYQWGYFGTIYSGLININKGFSGWQKFRRVIPNIYAKKQLYINLYGAYTYTGSVYNVNTSVYACYRNLKIYATSYKIAYRKGVRSLWQRIEATPGDAVINFRLKNKYYDIKYKEEAENIAEKTIEKTNSIEGRKIEIDTILGDITDSGLYNIIEQFQGQLVRIQTLAGVAKKFVVNYASDYLAGDVIISQGTGTETDTIYFTSAVPGQDFSGSTTIVNVSGNLTGTPSTVQANVPGTPEEAQLEISGIGGSVDITCNGVTKTMTFEFDIPTTIYNFIANYMSEYLAAGVQLTGGTNNIVFTTYPAAEFTEQPSFSNIFGDLAVDYTHLQNYAAGTARIDKIVLSGNSGLANITCNTVTKLAYFSYAETESWNDRYDPTTYKEINEYLADELKTQYALPAQKIMNLPVRIREGEGYQYRHLNCWLDVLNIDEQITPVKNISAWSTYNCDLSLNEENSILYVRKTSLGSDPQIYRDTSFSGLKNRWLIIKYRVNSNVPESGGGRTIFYKTAEHGYDWSYYKILDAFTSDGQWHLCIADMWNLTSGGTDWKNNTITGIRIDLDPQDNIIDLEFVGFPRKFVALREEFNVRECLVNIDLIEILK